MLLFNLMFSSVILATVQVVAGSPHQQEWPGMAKSFKHRAIAKPLAARTCSRSHRPATTRVATSSSSIIAPTPEVPSASIPSAATQSPHAPPAATTPKPNNPPSSSSSSPSNGESGPSSGSSSASGTVSSSDIQQYLDAHNSVRSQHDASPLTWNNTLESAAQKWADNCKFVHSGGSLGPFGENLAAGTGGLSISAGIALWANEASQYDSSNPQPSHFTQMVWKSSHQVGCAVQSCAGIFGSDSGNAAFYVCEYFPAGNVIGEFAQNVSA